MLKRFTTEIITYIRKYDIYAMNCSCYDWCL